MTWALNRRRSEFRVLRSFVAAFLYLVLVAGVSAGERSLLPETLLIPTGIFITGSNRAEREIAYQLDEAAYGHSITRRGRWYEGEGNRHSIDMPAYRITTNLITNAEYARFIQDTGRAVPDVSRETWAGYGLVHPYERTRRHAWARGVPPRERGRHPVVLVSHQDARAYATWLSEKTGFAWRLPSEEEWEKAARGIDGRLFPWGRSFDPSQLNSHDRGPFDTMAVGSFPQGASPFGLLDPAGQVFEWTATAAGESRWIVKGGSWDDRGCGVCRPAARHSRPENIKHILIGFRLVHGEQ